MMHRSIGFLLCIIYFLIVYFYLSISRIDVRVWWCKKWLLHRAGAIPEDRFFTFQKIHHEKDKNLSFPLMYKSSSYRHRAIDALKKAAARFFRALTSKILKFSTWWFERPVKNLQIKIFTKFLQYGVANDPEKPKRKFQNHCFHH